MLKRFAASIRARRGAECRGVRGGNRLTVACLALAPLILASDARAQTTGVGPQVDTRAGSPSGFTTNSFAGFRDGAGIGAVEDGVGEVAQFNQPVSIAVNPAGDRLFIADQVNESLRMFESVTSNFVTVATYPMGTTPVDVKVDGEDNIYVLSQGDGALIPGTIRRYDKNTNLLGVVNIGGLVLPTAMALDLETNIIVVEIGGALKKVDRGTGAVTPIVVTGGALAAPQGVEVLDSGALVVSDTGNHVIRYMTPAGAITNTVGMMGVTNRTLGGPTVASFSSPTKITKAGDNVLVVADTQNHRVVTITPEGIVSLLYGIDPAAWLLIEANSGLDPFLTLPGWEDAEGALASARVPSGVAVTGDGVVFTTELYYNTVRAVSNTGLKGPGGSISGSGGDTGGTPNPPAISIAPTSGYYPTGTDVTVTSSSADVFFRSDGQEPTTNDTRVVMVNGVGTLKWFEPLRDLSSLRVSAFLFSGTNVVSTNIAGVSSPVNEIGSASNLEAGIGATAVVPLVVNLNTNDSLRSLQFRVSVKPDPMNAVPLLGVPAGGFKFEPTSTNDFIQLAGANDMSGGAVTYIVSDDFDAVTSTRFLSVATLGPTNFNLTDFAAVAVLSVKIPNTAVEGDKFTISLLNPSGTSDGLQSDVSISAMADSTITVTNRSYLVGDTSPGAWYNAGQFGDGDLRNSDVNNAFLASLGIRVPYKFSDVFNAMDAYPNEAIGGTPEGDGSITIADWILIFNRSLRVGGSANFIRAWSTGGVHTNAGAVLPTLPDLGLPLALPGNVWSPDVQITAGSFDNVDPGEFVDIPVTVNLAPGARADDLGFRTSVISEGNAPDIEGFVSWTPLAGGSPIAGPQNPGINESGIGILGQNELGLGWISLDLESTAVIGIVRFQVPFDAEPEDNYRLQFSFAGVFNESGPALVETYSGSVAVLAENPPAAVVSDEWLDKFFGTIDQALASANMDSDGDGVSNLVEYLAGTSPTDPESRLSFTGSDLVMADETGSLKLEWLSAPGKTYVVECAEDMIAGPWTVVGTVSGDGDTKQIIAENAGDQRFYRIRLAQ